MKNFQLVVMAAGLGSRFGGLKQITPIDEEGNFIIDYSIYDAVKAGCNKVIFVIRKSLENDFKQTIGKRIEQFVKVEYAFQENDDSSLPDCFSNREKPLGTLFAVLVSKPYVDLPFVVINADDFYSREAFEQGASFLAKVNQPYQYACLSYPCNKTVSSFGSVKRGVLKLKNNHIIDIIESSVELKNGLACCTPLNGDDYFEVKEDAPVSMNMFAFQKDIYELLEEYLFQELEHMKNKESDEVLLPQCLNEYLHRQKIVIENQEVKGTWLGMTYQSDLLEIKEKIEDLKSKGTYPHHLWR